MSSVGLLGSSSWCDFWVNSVMLPFAEISTCFSSFRENLGLGVVMKPGLLHKLVGGQEVGNQGSGQVSHL